VDEVNLLEDHIVDLLLDSAAMGVNTVEREGVSFSHPAKFILVGTMNPEEGDLRPQLLDRFGLCVQVVSILEAEARIEILKRKAAFDANQEVFASVWEQQQSALAEQIISAKDRLRGIDLSDAVLEKIVGITALLNLDGHRPDIVTMKAAKTLAAFRGKEAIGADDIRDAAGLALSHRLKRLPFEDIGEGSRKLSAALAGIRS
jgi:magnesium chelatase subunit I